QRLNLDSPADGLGCKHLELASTRSLLPHIDGDQYVEHRGHWSLFLRDVMVIRVILLQVIAEGRGKPLVFNHRVPFAIVALDLILGDLSDIADRPFYRRLIGGLPVAA